MTYFKLKDYQVQLILIWIFNNKKERLVSNYFSQMNQNSHKLSQNIYRIILNKINSVLKISKRYMGKTRINNKINKKSYFKKKLKKLIYLLLI